MSIHTSRHRMANPELQGLDFELVPVDQEELTAWSWQEWEDEGPAEDDLPESYVTMVTATNMPEGVKWTYTYSNGHIVEGKQVGDDLVFTIPAKPKENDA